MGLRTSVYDCQVAFLSRENEGIIFVIKQPVQLRRLIV